MTFRDDYPTKKKLFDWDDFHDSFAFAAFVAGRANDAANCDCGADEDCWGGGCVADDAMTMDDADDDADDDRCCRLNPNRRGDAMEFPSGSYLPTC